MNMCRMTPLIVAGTITVLEQQRRDEEEEAERRDKLK